VFVRQDLPLAQQLVQTNHATFQMASRLARKAEVSSDETPSVVVIGLPDKPALEAAIQRLIRYKIAHEAFVEPDFDMGLSAIATVPIENSKQRKAMFLYKTWQQGGPNAD
jgi:glycosyltransferase A (GT-A) superfamily protein (DUF2064 family)